MTKCVGNHTSLFDWKTVCMIRMIIFSFLYIRQISMQNGWFLSYFLLGRWFNPLILFNVLRLLKFNTFFLRCTDKSSFLTVKKSLAELNAVLTFFFIPESCDFHHDLHQQNAFDTHEAMVQLLETLAAAENPCLHNCSPAQMARTLDTWHSNDMSHFKSNMCISHPDPLYKGENTVSISLLPLDFIRVLKDC